MGSLSLLQWIFPIQGSNPGLHIAGGFFTNCAIREVSYEVTKRNGIIAHLCMLAEGLYNSVQSLSHVRLFATPRTAVRQASLSSTISQSLLKLMSIESMMPSSPCHPLSSPSAPVFPSIRVFSNKSALRIRWPKDWSFSFSISPSSERSGLISFRMDWFDLFAVRGTLKSLLVIAQRSIKYTHISII